MVLTTGEEFAAGAYNPSPENLITGFHRQLTRGRPR